MTELQSGGGTTGETPIATADWNADSVPVAALGELFNTLAKALRAFQLYDENNPVRHRFIESLRGSFTSLWAEVETLKFSVDEDRIQAGVHEVYRSDDRTDSLAFLFYKDGIREIAFRPGIEGAELERFLSVLQRARKLLPEGDDLLTVLWEEGLEFFLYRYVDFLAEGVEMPVKGGGNSEADFKQVLEGDAEEGEAEEGDAEEGEEDAQEPTSGEAAEDDASSKTVSKEDFNPTLYSLDPREMKFLRTELQRELDRDLRMDVLSALFDRLEEPGRRERQSEILEILATLLPNFMSRGALVPATRVLHELRKFEATPNLFDEERMALSRRLLDEVSQPAFITEMIHALYDGTVRASPQQLADFLQFLRAEALAPLLRATETVGHKELQEVLRRATHGIAERNRGAVLRLLSEQDAVVAAGAARIAGEMQIKEAGPALADLLAHPNASVRLAAVEAAVSLKASTAAGALQATLDDPDREVRIAAARALGELKYRPAGGRLGQIVQEKEIRDADITEKVAMFEAYALVADEAAVRLMDKLLNGKGFLGKREPSEIRAAAALGLGCVTSLSASRALQKAAGDDDAVVRSAVNRALREGE